jgi:hypothetical protein
MAEKTEKLTQTILGIFAILMLIIFTVASLGAKYDFTKYVIMITGFVLSLTLISEAGVYQYFRSKSYKKIGFGDVVVLLAILLAGSVLINSFLMISMLSEVAPTWLITYSQASGTTIGILGLIVAIVLMITPRVKF